MMAEGKESREWNFFASLMTLQANCNRDPKKPAFDVFAFHPFLEKPASSSGLGDYLVAKKETARRRRLRPFR